MSTHTSDERGGFDEILHAFAGIIKTLHFLGAFAIVYTMMNKIGEDIKQKLRRPEEKIASPAVVERRCPLSNIAQVKTPVRDTFGVCLTDQVRYICDGQTLTARSDVIWRVQTCSCYDHDKHSKPKSKPEPEKVLTRDNVLGAMVLAPVLAFVLAIILAILVWLFNLDAIAVWWDEGIAAWAKQNAGKTFFLSLVSITAWLFSIGLCTQGTRVKVAVKKIPCSTIYFVDGTVMKHVTMLTPAMDFATITGVQQLDLKRSDSQTACGLTADEMRALADRLKEVISDHRYEIAHVLGVERYNRTVRLLPDLKVFDTET